MTPPLLAQIHAGACPDMDSLVAAFSRDLPMLLRLKETPQDQEWHAEGDVHLHTGMVLDSLYRSLQETPVSPEERLELVLGALLHDIAKPFTTRPMEIQGKMRVAALGHEAKGRSYLVPRLLSWGLPYPSLQSILGLVGDHLYPKQLVKKSKGIEEWRKIARRSNLRLLTLLELADLRGRICKDQKEQVELVELFGLYAEEYQVTGWEQRWQQEFSPLLQGRSPEAQAWILGELWRLAEEGRLNSPEEGSYLAYQVPDPLPELVVLMGPSGAGKSTWAEKNLLNRGFQRVSLDELREEISDDRSDQTQNGQVRQLAKERLKAALRGGGKVVYDATCLRRDIRNQVCGTGFAYRALVTMVCFHKSEAEYQKGNRNRQHAVPANVLEQQLRMMEWPERQEAHRMLVIGPEGKELARMGFWG